MIKNNMTENKYMVQVGCKCTAEKENEKHNNIMSTNTDMYCQWQQNNQTPKGDAHLQQLLMPQTLLQSTDTTKINYNKPECG